MTPALRLDHVAFPTFDLAATDRFYCELLGLERVFAHAGRSAEWGDRDYAIASYATADGRVIDFFALGGVAQPAPDGLPADIRHVALAVESLDALDAWKRRLADARVAFAFDDHGGAHPSLYLTDPNGLVVEITCWLRRPGADAAARAADVVRAWSAAHEPRAPR
jgi:catechol 2,3-dioxygenase-like lactoylglutathione lyase family enzyme